MLALNSFIMLISFLFIFSNHPLALGALIVTQTLIISLCITIFSASPWFSYILLMVYLSGMMIIFIYVSSVAANELTSKNVLAPSLFMVSAVMLTIIISSVNLTSPNKQSLFNELSIELNNNFSLDIFKMYSPHTASMTAMLIFYLLLVMIMVVKITSLTKGPLRSQK